jgi:hypothetical protein
MVDDIFVGMGVKNNAGRVPESRQAVHPGRHFTARFQAIAIGIELARAYASGFTKGFL